MPTPQLETTPRTTDLVNIFQQDTMSTPAQSTVANLSTTVLAQPAVTQAPGNSTTKVATTAFVAAAIAGGASGGAQVTAVNTANQTSISTTPANVTGLTATLTAGQKYCGRLVMYVSTDQVADGARFDFDGGNATFTEFRAAVVSNIQGATLSVTQTAAIATDIIATDLASTNPHCIVIEFEGLVNAGGTFIPRAGQEAHSSGTLTMLTGCNLTVVSAT